MTTRPKASKFRTHRSSVGSAAPSNTMPAETVDSPEAQDTEAQQPAATSIVAIQAEGLTGRQLRMARRLAQKQGYTFESDFDAVRQLRLNGIDPFQKPAVAGQEEAGKTQLPQKIEPKKVSLPSTELSPAEQRMFEIKKVQKEIAKRRRRKVALLFARLAAFIMLPTIIAGFYYYSIATPMYSSKTQMQILTADGAGTTVGGGFFQGTSFQTAPDSIATQGYLQSIDAMLRLDRELDFKAYFTGDAVDPLQRLPDNPTNEDVYKLYKKYIKLGYDPTDGVIKMEVSTPTPEFSAAMSRTLIDYAEQQVDNLSLEKRRDTLDVSEASLQSVRNERKKAQERLVELQEATIIEPSAVIGGIQGLINSVEAQLQDKTIALRTQLLNPRPNQSKVDALESEIKILEEELAYQNSRMTEATEGDTSLAAKAAEIEIARADLASLELSLQAALEIKRQSEIEANKQVRYLTVNVSPVVAQSPSYPRAFENTLVAFFIFAGIYLMISLTASVLKEQISS